MAHSKSHSDSKKLLKTLREVLKAKRITYGKLAKKLEVSEVTIKRIFSNQNCNLQMIFEICDSIEISFFDLSSLANQDHEINYFLTLEQENFFALHPAYFGLLKSLHRGTSTADLARQWGLTPQKLFRVLRKLERLDLLDVLPKNQIRLKVIGNIRYQHQGPLARKILRPQIVQFLNHVDASLKDRNVCMHSAEAELSKSHISELVNEIHALGAKYRAKALRDRSLLPSDKIESVRWLFAFAPYQTDWQQYELDELA